MFIICAFFLHFVFLLSIFDIYFKSPIVKDVNTYEPLHTPLADRLVLFVVDGLRAESFVNHSTMANLKHIANSRGRWGISSTQVPTESRPGHVAIIAGFYEDPSAVLKGWKENPVDFDSVLNQTLYTWCWGAYDIINIFTKGVSENHIIANKYDPYEQSFSTDKNTTLLDSWVFQRVEDLFSSAKQNKVLNERLHEKKIMFFLHLLGTDTSGHTHKPNTNNYLTTLKHADEGIIKMQKFIEEFYNNDHKTTFLMTSDHGMTNWGSHGAGDDHETKTPYVLWGSGVQIPEDGIEANRRYDINQVDIAPLMSTLLSIPIPVNSIGQLPIQLLNASLQDKAKAIYGNSRQLAASYDKIRKDIEENAIHFVYTPYKPLDKTKLPEMILHTELLISEGKYDKLILLSEEMSRLSLLGIQYYHTYYESLLLKIISLAFCGWIMYLVNIVSRKANSTYEVMLRFRKSNWVFKQMITVIFTFISILCFYFIYAQKLPIQFYVYCSLPIVLWWNIFSTLDGDTWRSLSRNSTLNVAVHIVFYTIGTISLAYSFTFRWALSIPLLGMAFWPLSPSMRSHLSKRIILFWMSSCLLLSMFSYMPVVGKETHIELVLLAGLLWLGACIIFMRNVLIPLSTKNLDVRKDIYVNGVQIFVLMLGLHNLYTQSKRFDMGTPVLIGYQVMAWIIAASSILFPMVSTMRMVSRLFTINTAFLTFYILLSVSHEGLFLFTLILNVNCWTVIEFKLLNSDKSQVTDCSFSNEEDKRQRKKSSITNTERILSLSDFRRSFYFLLYIVLAFFGTGNIASINSFEVRWVTCFITSFQPFVITTLILLKTFVPFLIVACNFNAIQSLTKAPVGYLHKIVLIFCSAMGLILLYRVKNKGSWLEIGTSISQFVIVQTMTLFIVLLHYLSKIVTQTNVNNLVNSIFKVRKKNV